MEKKLYRVKVLLYVMAENESDACAAATRARFDIFECTARRAEHVDPEWNEAIPYNADDERTCLEIMNNQKQTVSPETAGAIVPRYIGTAISPFIASS
jgi:hypothetical protein